MGAHSLKACQVGQLRQGMTTGRQRQMPNWKVVHRCETNSVICSCRGLHNWYRRADRAGSFAPKITHRLTTSAATIHSGIPPVCFDAACQAQADQAFLLATGLPILAAVAAAVLVYGRRPVVDAGGQGSRTGSTDGLQTFEDPASGAVFEAPGLRPERDVNVSVRMMET
jgi:hypothetical protein